MEFIGSIITIIAVATAVVAHFPASLQERCIGPQIRTMLFPTKKRGLLVAFIALIAGTQIWFNSPGQKAEQEATHKMNIACASYQDRIDNYQQTKKSIENRKKNTELENWALDTVDPIALAQGLSDAKEGLLQCRREWKASNPAAK